MTPKLKFQSGGIWFLEDNQITDGATGTFIAMQSHISCNGGPIVTKIVVHCLNERLKIPCNEIF